MQVRHVEGVWSMKVASGLAYLTASYSVPFWDVQKGPDITISTSTYQIPGLTHSANKLLGYSLVLTSVSALFCLLDFCWSNVFTQTPDFELEFNFVKE